jgi:hypothetical protein
MINRDEFLQDFRELLEKHKVYIAFSVGQGSDCHGLYDERLLVINENTNETVFETDGWTLSNTDIKLDQYEN